MIFRKNRLYLMALFIILLIVLLFLFLNTRMIGRFMYPIYYEDEIMQSAIQYNVDPLWIAAIIRVESNFRAQNKSSSGAIGVMQIMPETAQWIIGERSEFSDSSLAVLEIPTVNIRMGAWYVRFLHDHFDPHFKLSDKNELYDQLAVIAAAYNAGPGKVNSWLESGEWDGNMEHIEQIPFGETRHYVQRVDYYYKKFKNLYNELNIANKSTE